MIIDTDPGVDDAVALMLAAASPEVQLLAVTTVFGNAGVEVTTANALRLRTLAGLGNLPVAAGAARPLVYSPPQRADRHGRDGLSGHAELLPDARGPVNALGAVPLMATLLRGAVAPVTLVAIGPLTNIALLLAVHPEVKPRIGRIVIMGGNFGGSPAEFNISSDPEAAHRVLVEEDVATTLVPWNLTQRATVDGAWLAELAAAGPRCAALAGIIGQCRQQRSTPVALHDPLAVLEATVSGTLTTAPMALQVVCDHGRDRGAVRRDNGPQRPVQVACDADLSSINAMILHRLGTLR
jgi:pyrimidine-specific ribonucleoside hydrolase